MQTLIEILKKTENYFCDKGIENPRLNAELIIARALGMKRLELYLSFDRPLTASELDLLRPLVKRRASREPIQYIEGYSDFLDIRLKVDRRCLIPRPETEELIEWIKDSQPVEPKRILDLGTGSGAIAISLAKIYQNASILAVDKNRESLELAKENAILNNLSDRIEFRLSDWFNSVEGSFDLVVSNPPYLTEQEWQEACPEVKDFEPKMALTSEDEGFADISNILRLAPAYMSTNAGIYIESGIKHTHQFKNLDNTELKLAECRNDLSGRQRFFRAFKI